MTEVSLTSESTLTATGIKKEETKMSIKTTIKNRIRTICNRAATVQMLAEFEDRIEDGVITVSREEYEELITTPLPKFGWNTYKQSRKLNIPAEGIRIELGK